MGSADAANILVVDDNPANLRLLSQILAERGHHVRAVTGGQRALESVRIDPPDMILLDIRMPGLDGYEVCERLKATPELAAVPVLFISALDDTEDKVRAFRAGGLDYICKPFQLEEVIARVETHLTLHALQRRLEEANRRMALELELAARVQASFMPGKLPELPGWDLAVALLPAKLTSGDFYDVVALPGGALALVMADVVDKGVGAALYMAMSIALLRAALAEFPERPAAVLETVSRQLSHYASGGQFVTVFLGVLDVEPGQVVYANAGQNPPLLVRCAGPQAPVLLRNTGMALGVDEDAQWAARSAPIERGDALILYSDGVTDAENDRHEFFEMERLIAVARLNAGRPAAAIRDAVLDSVHRFTAGADQADDIALLVAVRR